MKRRIIVATVLCLVLLATVAVAAPAAMAGATIINYTSQEQLVEFNMSAPVSYGSVVKVTMANHLVDYGATNPWGNGDVYTHSSWVIHTVGGAWADSTFSGSYRTEGPYGDTKGWFTGTMSWATGAMDYRFSGQGVSGDLAGTLWKGIVHNDSFPALPSQFRAQVVVLP
jgi:hypothetical protein